MEPTVHEVSPAQAVRMIQRGALLLDVREEHEWQAGHAPEALHMPMSTVPARTAELPEDRTILCICHVGGRSAAVAAALVRAGWDAVNVAGGMEAWAAEGLTVVDLAGRPGAVG